MRHLKDLPLRQELTIIIALTSGLAILLVCVILVAYETMSYRATMLRGLQTSTQIVAINSAAPLSFEDRESAKEALAALSVEPGVVLSRIYDKEGDLFAEYIGQEVKSLVLPPPSEGDQAWFDRGYLLVNRRIEHRGQFLGSVFVQASMTDMYAMLRRTILGALLIGMVTLGATLLFSLFLQRQISGPIVRLLQVMKSISVKRDYSLRAKKEADNELGHLVDGFNSMLTEIQRRELDLIDARDSLEERVEERTTALNALNQQLRANELELTQSNKRLEANRITLQEERDKAQRYLDISGTIFVVLDANGTVELLNKAGCDILGYEPGELIGKDWFRIAVPPDVRDETRGVFGRVMREDMEGVAYYENHVLTKNRELKMIAWHNAVLSDSEGRRIGTLSSGEDITERRAMEVQLRHAQKLESVGQLASGIAHEINTPIQFVGDNVRFLKDSFSDTARMLEVQSRLIKSVKEVDLPEELMRELATVTEDADIEYLEEEVPKAIEQSLEGIKRVATIVSAMKEFSHQGTQDFTACDVNRAVEGTIIISGNEWKYVADMKTELDVSLPTVECIQGELNQAILNLIVNAAHAIADVVSEGDSKSAALEKGTITIATRSDGDWVEISVADTGAGIPEAAQAHIFEPFFTTKEVGKGTGQGLSIAHNTITAKHGGQLTFETEKDKGTTFFIRLPFKRK